MHVTYSQLLMIGKDGAPGLALGVRLVQHLRNVMLLTDIQSVSKEPFNRLDHQV
jgi:3-polyprenyl-4-hydroxybenzoate decarboxylase